MSNSISSSESESELLCNSDCSECLEKERQENTEKLAEKVLLNNSSSHIYKDRGVASFGNAGVANPIAVAGGARASGSRQGGDVVPHNGFYYHYKDHNDTSLNLDNYA